MKSTMTGPTHSTTKPTERSDQKLRDKPALLSYPQINSSNILHLAMCFVFVSEAEYSCFFVRSSQTAGDVINILGFGNNLNDMSIDIA